MTATFLLTLDIPDSLDHSTAGYVEEITDLLSDDLTVVSVRPFNPAPKLEPDYQ